MSFKNSFADRKILLKSQNLLEEHANEMHRWLLLTVAIFSLAFSLVSLMLHDYLQAFVSILSVPGVGLAYLLYKRGYLYLSKVFNGLQITAMISTVSLLTGPETLTFMYFFPITISAIIAFQGKERYAGYALISIIFIVLIILTTIPIPADKVHLNPQHLKVDRFANVIGVTICCVIILVFMIKTLDNVQKQLLQNSNVLRLKNQALLTASYSRDQLMSIIAHDLRSPMAAVIVTVDVCSKPNIDFETKNELLHSLKTKALQVMTMTDQLLDWSRSQTGNLECKKESIAVNHFNNYTKEWSNLFGETKNIQLEIKFCQNADESIVCDKNMIETVLRNLISNAIKFSPSDSTINFSSYVHNHKRVFEIQDYGKGMTEEELQNLKDGISFTTYGTNREKGNGFGLQLVQEFLRRHDSYLEVESKLGEGSTFRFVI
jgi:signal transduction histidine kinase